MIMGNRKGKKFKNKGKTIQRPDVSIKMMKVKATNALVPATIPHSERAHAGAYTPGVDGSRVASDGNADRLPGYIFMCNGKTKPECYQYRVFGLPAGNTEVIEKIKPGTKLFLFDFGLKLLYGVYEASSVGGTNLEPAAFQGRFPCQVRFQISKDCLPLLESSFRNAIQNNYQGSKFRTELSEQQVRNLLSLFQPLAGSSSAPVPSSVPNVVLQPQPMQHSAVINYFNPSSRMAPIEDPYVAFLQQSRTQPLMEPQPVQQKVLTSHESRHGSSFIMDRVHPRMEPPPVQQEVLPSQQGWYRMSATMNFVHPDMERQGLPAPNNLPESHGPYLAEDPGQAVLEPYLRYRTAAEMVPLPRDRLTGMESEYYRYPLQPYGQQVVQPQASSSARRGLVEGSVSVSSYYSFAGARIMR